MCLLGEIYTNMLKNVHEEFFILKILKFTGNLVIMGGNLKMRISPAQFSCTNAKYIQSGLFQICTELWPNIVVLIIQ